MVVRHGIEGEKDEVAKRRALLRALPCLTQQRCTAVVPPSVDFGNLGEGKDILIATKLPSGFFSRTESMPQALEASLARLGRKSVELYQHHFPSSQVSIPKLMDLMADAVKAGKIKAVGVSNYSAAQMRIAHAALAKHGIALASNQVEYSLLHRHPEVNGVLDSLPS